MPLITKKIDGISFSFVNEKEFAAIYHDIFSVEDWRFATNTSSPFILDCGAHIGVSVLYFKKLYPQAKVVAFEPNPDAFKLLELNVRQNNLSNVELVNSALFNSTEEIDFYISEETSNPSTWAWGNAGVKNIWYNSDTYKTIKVPSVRLSSYIKQNVDFLKIDIEGMEALVTEEIERKLHLVKQLKMEFHGSSTNTSNSIERIFSILNRNGFKSAITQENKLIRVNQIERTESYFLMLYASRQRSTLWWHTQVLRNMNRLHRLMKGNLYRPYV